jgi:Replication-relaxation
MRSSTDDLYQDVREAITELRTELAQRGLPATLREYAEEYEDRHGITVSLHGEDATGALSTVAAYQLLRIVQEGLANERRRASATIVSRTDMVATLGTVYCLVFLEYDRGTERPHQYAAKIRAYYRYRDSGQSARDYSGFPTVLFVTTHPIAELRMAELSRRAAIIRGTEPLPLMTTNMDLILRSPQGILGPIWRTGTPSESIPPRRYWLPGSAPKIWLVRSGISGGAVIWTVQKRRSHWHRAERLNGDVDLMNCEKFGCRHGPAQAGVAMTGPT